jgi:hypothetical protein
MPTITFISTSSPNTPIKSVDFGQCALGLQTPKMLTYTVTTDEPDQTFVGTLKMLPGSGGSNTVFVASLVSQILSVSPGHIGTTALPSSGTNPTIGATTSGASGSTNQYTFSAVTPSSALLARPPYTYGITIDFSPPDTPLPAVWTATLQIYWTPPNQTDAVLLAELSLTGKTAQLTMNVTTPGAIELNPGSTVTVPLRLEYDSVDDATISVNIGPSTVFGFPDYAGLDIHKATVDMPATYVTGFVPMNHHSHIVGSIGGSGGSGVVQNQRLLQLHRIVDSKVEISAEETVQPGKNKTTYIGYTAPFISAAVGGPNACPVIFDIAPAPITFSIKDKQPIDIIRGRSASVDISVSYNGCPTNLIFDQPNGQPPIKITSSTTFGIGFNSNTEVSLIISAADDATTTTTEQVTIEIPWTANDGLSKSTLKVSSLIAAFVSNDSVSLSCVGHLPGHGSLRGRRMAAA